MVTTDTVAAGHHIPAGTVVFEQLHRNERVWSEPEPFAPSR